MDILIIADMHYTGAAKAGDDSPGRKTRLGLEFAVRAVRHAMLSGRPDVIILAGDIVEDGDVEGAETDLREVQKTFAAFAIPLIVTPGNHDGTRRMFQSIFSTRPGAQEIGDHVFITFDDRYDSATDTPSRPAGGMDLLRGLKNSGKPLIAVQHAAVLPPMEYGYPYNLHNAREIAACYAQAGVCLSISGHYHAGSKPLVENGVNYVVCPAVCEDPFRYTRVKIEQGRVVSVVSPSLSLRDTPFLFDAHIHTEFAYCATDINIDGAMERLELLGLARAGMVEHAEQLYLSRDGFWAREDGNNLAALRKSAGEGHSRHPQFRQRLHGARGKRILLGLEAEPAMEGRGLALFDEDNTGYDYMIGAVHNLAEGNGEPTDHAGTDRQFMRRTRQLLDSGVHILAHPMRYFRRTQKRPAPRELYKPVIDLLAERRVAAEINFHTNVNDPEFFDMCVRRGVKLSLGSDSHCMLEVGDLHPHLGLLKQLGVMGRLDEVLWMPELAVW